MTQATRNHAETLRHGLLGAEVNADYSEAVLSLRDGSRLCFCHRVDERWAKAVGPKGDEANSALAGELLVAIMAFRLNAKHLDIQFGDGSRWEERLRASSP